MSWEDQGRQEHGWFGNGMSSNTASADTDDLLDRITWTAHASLMRLPRKDWHTEAATFAGQRVKWLQKAMAAWVGLAR